MDSNHRRRKPADLQSAPVGHLGNLPRGGSRSQSVNASGNSNETDPVVNPLSRSALRLGRGVQPLLGGFFVSTNVPFRTLQAASLRYGRQNVCATQRGSSLATTRGAGDGEERQSPESSGAAKKQLARVWSLRDGRMGRLQGPGAGRVAVPETGTLRRPDGGAEGLRARAPALHLRARAPALLSARTDIVSGISRGSGRWGWPPVRLRGPQRFVPWQDRTGASGRA
jgi:hypothetical protein